MKKLIYILPLLFFAKITLAQDKQQGTLQTIKVQGGGGGGHVDTTSLSNRINLKLAIDDTTGRWLSAGTVIPAQVNILEGTNITVTGTYPNITISSTGGGSTDTTSLSNRINSKQDTSYHTNFYAESPLSVRDTMTIDGEDTTHGVIISISNTGVDSTFIATTAGQTVFTFPYILTDYMTLKEVKRNGGDIDPSEYTISGSDITFTGFTCDVDDKIRFVGVK